MDDVTGLKRMLRRRILAQRARRTPAQLHAAATALSATGLAAPAVRDAGVVAAYAALPGEPDPGILVAALARREVRVLLPILTADHDLDWAAYDGRGTLRDGRAGTREPTGPPLGRGAPAEADVVLVPGLAVSRTGVRLGRGGGSYDRALARLSDDRPSVVVLFDDEVLTDVPAAPHDVAVSAVLTPSAFRTLER